MNPISFKYPADLVWFFDSEFLQILRIERYYKKTNGCPTKPMKNFLNPKTYEEFRNVVGGALTMLKIPGGPFVALCLLKCPVSILTFLHNKNLQISVDFVFLLEGDLISTF